MEYNYDLNTDCGPINVSIFLEKSRNGALKHSLESRYGEKAQKSKNVYNVKIYLEGRFGSPQTDLFILKKHTQMMLNIYFSLKLTFCL